MFSLEQLKAEQRELERKLRLCKKQIRALTLPVPKQKRDDSLAIKKQLKARQDTLYAKRKFHKAVFKKYGDRCFFCSGQATDAAHIITAAQLGTDVAYKDHRLGRPLCAECHALEESNLSLKFPLELYQEAARVHNIYSRVKLHIPEE